MEAVKRIEIVVSELLLRELTDLLDRHQVGGYTVFRGLGGKGDRGFQSGDGAAGEFGNASVLVVCHEPMVPPLMAELKPLLKRFGGMCLVSEAMWLKH